jgi:hypothetical protein
MQRMTLGLVVLVVLAVYGALMIGAMLCGWFWGRRKQGSRRKAAAYAGIGFLVVYLPIFWNHLPFLLRHKWLCARDAGFTQYVDPAVWRAEHDDEIRQLTVEELRAYKYLKETDGSYVTRMYGGLLERRRLIERSSFLRVPVTRVEIKLISADSPQVMLVEVDYGFGGGRDDIRSWIFPNSCRPKDSAPPYELEKYIGRIKES